MDLGVSGTPKSSLALPLVLLTYLQYGGGNGKLAELFENLHHLK